jgi:hypothetical protein
MFRYHFLGAVSLLSLGCGKGANHVGHTFASVDSVRFLVRELNSTGPWKVDSEWMGGEHQVSVRLVLFAPGATAVDSIQWFAHVGAWRANRSDTEVADFSAIDSMAKWDRIPSGTRGLELPRTVPPGASFISFVPDSVIGAIGARSGGRFQVTRIRAIMWTASRPFAAELKVYPGI